MYFISIYEGWHCQIVLDWTGLSVGGASEESTAAEAVFVKGTLCVLPFPTDLSDL